MDRRPEHFQQDSRLRETYCQQTSLDEFGLELLVGLETETAPELVALCERLKTLDEASRNDVFYELWIPTLNPQTSMVEALYLMGITERATRNALLDQQHAELREAAINQGLIIEEPPFTI